MRTLFLIIDYPIPSIEHGTEDIDPFLISIIFGSFIVLAILCAIASIWSRIKSRYYPIESFKGYEGNYGHILLRRHGKILLETGPLISSREKTLWFKDDLVPEYFAVGEWFLINKNHSVTNETKFAKKVLSEIYGSI